MHLPGGEPLLSTFAGEPVAAPVDVGGWPAWSVDTAPVGLLQVQGDTILRANRTAAAMLGVGPSELTGSSLQRWFSTTDLAPLLQPPAAVASAFERVAHVRLRAPAEGATRALCLRAAVAAAGPEDTVLMTLNTEDADPAAPPDDGPAGAGRLFDTGRSALLHRLDGTLAQAGRNDRIVGLLVLQIDQIQRAIETFGYAGGDALIEAVGRRLVSAGAEGIVHLGSGEFAAESHWLPAPAEATAQKVAQSWMQALAEPFMIGGSEMHISCSIGAALYPTDGCDPALLLDRAQAAMRQAHGWGSNHVFFHTPEASARATSRLALESALRHALERREMSVCYQPQIDLYSGRIVGVEALARWRHGERGDIPPAEFIPLAEQTGLIVSIGEWVLRESCAQGVRWQGSGLPPVRIGVNLSMQQLELPDMAARVRTILRETGLPPAQLGLEITESMLFENVDAVASTLAELRADGIEIALDDFGTGYSNLGYLSKLPIDVLKIDRAFVPDVTTAPGDVSIARAMIRLAHSLHMKVLAEGVETAGQLAMLVASNCDQVQGYFFSRPVPPAAVVEMLLRGLPTLGTTFRRRCSVERLVLVVDGDTARREAAGAELASVSDEVLVAGRGEEALRLLAEHDVGVLVCAHVLPDMDGMLVLGQARSLYPGTMRICTVAEAPPPSLDAVVNGAAVFRVAQLPGDAARLRADVDDAFRDRDGTGYDRSPLVPSQWQTISGEVSELRRRFDGLTLS